MGIKSNFSKNLRQLHPHVYQTVPLRFFSGKSIAIDASPIIYRFLSSAIKEYLQTINVEHGFKLDRSAIQQRWLKKWTNLVSEWIDADVKLVFVLDGAAPIEKKEVKDKRNENQEAYSKRLDELSIEMADPKLSRYQKRVKIEEIHSLLKRKNVATAEERKMLADLLRELGATVIQAQGEADPVCAKLEIDGHCDATMSTDADMLAYGCSVIISNFTVERSPTGRNRYSLEVILLSEVLKALELKKRSFVDFCIMCGVDYNENIDGIGFKLSLELLKKYRNIDRIARKTGIDVSILKHETCRNLFNVKTLELDLERVLTVKSDGIVSTGKTIDCKKEIDSETPFNRE